ncbi:MAG: alpha/beta hydrolase [Spirochaetes bacterium]|nr:alpha/beta hydrolase [Spirochaetota bacterium]
MNVREGFVESEGHHLAYLAVNEHLAKEEEPSIVFIHGVLASVNFWLDCVPPGFKEDRAWYSLSLPAHHPSTVPPDFAPEQVDEQWFFRLMNGALKELLGGKKAVIVGHSTGGFAALILAIHKAPNVIGIISIAGFHSGHWGGVEGLLVKLAGLGRWAKGLFASNIALARRSSFIQRTFSSLLAYNRKAYRSSPLSQRFIENIGPNTRQQDSDALFSLFNAIGPLEIADQLHQISIPCYIFAGTHDPVVPAKQSLVLAGNIRHAKTVVFRNVGHMPFMEDTEAYFTALEQALTDIAGPHHHRTNNKLEEVKEMNYPQYKKDLQRVHESEVYGRAVFTMAALFTWNAERKKKWLALKALEEKTLERYIAHMKNSGQQLTEPAFWKLKGYFEGVALGLLPWRLSMKLLGDATVPFQEKFLRLKSNAESNHQEFFNFVYAHEKAIEAFANKELSRDGKSLTAVEHLLAG